jgi:hypothetical protein
MYDIWANDDNSITESEQPMTEGVEQSENTDTGG